MVTEQMPLSKKILTQIAQYVKYYITKNKMDKFSLGSIFLD